MRHTPLLTIFFFLQVIAVNAQQTDTKHIRVVDSLTAQEKINRNPLLLRSEIDSLVKLYAPVQEPKQVLVPVVEKKDISDNSILGGLVLIVLLMGALLALFYHNQRKIIKTMKGLHEKEERKAMNQPLAKEKPRSKTGLQSLESKINDLNAELLKLSKENEGLNRVVREYNGIQHEYDSLKHGFQKIYKVKNYPGYDKAKDEVLAMQGVFTTESSVANYAFEKFLKPVLAIADANKNNPAKMSEADQVKLLDLLVSLSLLYIEYLYLRVSDLSIGGTMVERIQGLAKGNSPDPALLKKLNMEFGSRALVIRMALSKACLQHLSYPVFDETNLNNQ